MKIIAPGHQLDTNQHPIVMTFDNDDEFNQFLARLAGTPALASGMRIINLIPENMVRTPLQQSIVDIIEGLDGIGGNNQKTNEKILNDSIDSVHKILDQKL